MSKEIKSSDEATKFINEFKDKIITHLNSKPKQDLKSFLKNFENLMFQHKQKMMKNLKIDVVDKNYDLLLVWTLYCLHEDSAFECQILN